MLTHLQLACWVIKAVLVAMALSGSGCSHAVATPETVAKAALNHPWDGPETIDAHDAGKSSGEAAVCQCGAGCACKTTPNNPACACDKCVCDHSVDANKKVATPFAESKQEPGDYESHRIRLRLVVSGSCGPCRAIESMTLPPMRAAGWQVAPGKHIEVVYGSGQVPRWERIVDGRIVATQYGYMGPYQVDKFLTGGVEPKRRAK